MSSLAKGAITAVVCLIAVQALAYLGLWSIGLL